MKQDKHYLSIYYGIDENLPDDEFYQRVKEINQECEESTKKFNSPCIREKGGILCG